MDTLRYSISTATALALAAFISANSSDARVGLSDQPTMPRLAEFDSCVQQRFRDNRTFGLSRIITFNVLGTHFRPSRSNTDLTKVSDFSPETPQEEDIISMLEADDWRLGLYVFGDSIRVTEPDEYFHRALKGPATHYEGHAATRE